MLNENIKNIRKRKGYTQEELAARLHVVRQTVSKWEKGLSVPDAETVQKIAAEMDVSVSELLGADIGPAADKNEVAEQLSRINEQMAIYNRRASLIWKSVGIVLTIALIISLSFIFLKTGKAGRGAETMPDTIEIYSVNILEKGNNTQISFVPSFGNDTLEYTVTLHCATSADIPDKTAAANYSKGICTVYFGSHLIEYEHYNIVLTIGNGLEERNITILEDLSKQGSSFSWSGPDFQ